jgi:hypothetical protein
LGLGCVRREATSEREHKHRYDSKNEPRRQWLSLTVQREHHSHLSFV